MVYIVVHDVDLGYHIDAVFSDKEKAEAKVAELNVEHNKEMDKHFPKDYPLRPTDQYYIEEHEVI